MFESSIFEYTIYYKKRRIIMVTVLAKKILHTIGVLLLFLGTNLNAAQSQAEEIMLNAYRYIGSMDKYAFEVTVNDDLEATGPAARLFKQTISVKVDRPGNFRIDVTGDRKNRSKYLDNGTFTIFDHGNKYYGQLKVADTIDETLDLLDEKYGFITPLAALLYSDMDKRTTLSTGKYFGKTKIAGIECDYIAFKNKNRVLHIWITSGDKPLIKSYRIIDNSANENVNSGGFLKWTTNAAISDNDFVFIPPEGAEKISVNSANQ